MRLIIIVATVISGFVTISLVFFQATRKTYPGFDRWTAGVGFLTLGCSAFALRGLIPDALSIFIGNIAFPLGLVLHLDGLRRFLGSGSMPKLWYAIPAVDLVATAILYYAYDSAFWRSVVTGTAVSVPHWAMAHLIFRHPVKCRSIFYPVIGALLCLAGLVVLARPVSAVFVGHWHILTDSPFQLSSIVILIVLQVGESLSLMMLNSERVERELLETEADLRQTVDRLERALAEQKKTEEALLGSEERFKQVAENAGEWIWEVDANGVFQYCSSAVGKILGYSPNELVGQKRFYDLFAPEARESLTQAALEVFEAGNNFRTFVGTGIHKDGRIVVFQTSGSPLFDEQGTLIGYHGTGIDITERKQTEEALRESEERYRSLFENMLEGFAYCKMIFENGVPNDYMYIKVNNSFERLTGLKDVVGRKITEAIPNIRESNPELFEIYGRVVLTGKPEQFETYIKPLRIWLSISAYSPEEEHFVTVFDNITKRKQAEEGLRESERNFRLVTETIQDVFWMSTPDIGKIVYVSPAYEKIWGRTTESLYSSAQSFWETIHPIDREHVASVLRQYHSKGKAYTSEYRIALPDDSIRWILQRGFPICDEQGIFKFMCGVSTDITERKNAGELLAQSEQMLRGILFTSPVAIGLTVDRKMKWVNQAWEETFGFEKRQYLGQDASIVYSSQAEYKRVGEELYPNLALGHVTQTDAKFIRGDGSIFDGQIRMKAIDPSDPAKGTIAAITDISERKKAEEALRESEENYRSLLEESFDGMFLTRGTKIVLTNSRLREILGYEKGELEGKYHWTIYHPDYQAITRSRGQARLMDQPAINRYEVKVQRKDRSSFDCELIAKKVRVGGKPGIQAWFRDITERKQAEWQLQLEKDRLKGILGHMNDGVCIVSPQHEIEYINPLIAEKFGDVTGRKCYQYFHRRTEPCPWCKNSEVFAGKPVKWERHIDETGEAFEIFEAPIENADGSVSKLEIVHDITDRKQAEQDRVRLVTAIEQAAETVVMADADMTIVYVNPAFELTTGYSRNEAVGHSLRIPLGGHHEEQYKDMLDTITSGRVWSGHLINRKKDGTLFEEEATISPVKDESGQIVNYVGVKRDVTKEALLQKQLLQAQKMEAVGTLAGGVAHDFNNLLTIVMGFSELLLAEKDQMHPEYADLEKIFHAATRGADLVQRLLMFSRKSEPKPAPMNLNKQILQVEKLLLRTIPKMIDIKLELSANLPDINADMSQVEQVLMNLAINARDAMPANGTLTIATKAVTIDGDYCRLHLEANPGEYVLLEVSDTGHGMDTKTMERMFEPFFTTKEIGRGTGLGLAIVYGIVKQHNGHIAVHSEVGEGTTFGVYIPAIEAEAETDVETTAVMPAFGTETVLLVDDEQFVRELGARILTKHGYTVLQAINGREALDLFKKETSRISLVILDLIMPEMGGTECLKELLKIDPHVKVLIASGYSAEASREETIRMGAKCFVGKPFHAAELLQNIREILNSEDTILN